MSRRWQHSPATLGDLPNEILENIGHRLAYPDALNYSIVLGQAPSLDTAVSWIRYFKQQPDELVTAVLTSPEQICPLLPQILAALPLSTVCYQLRQLSTHPVSRVAAACINVYNAVVNEALGPNASSDIRTATLAQVYFSYPSIVCPRMYDWLALEKYDTPTKQNKHLEQMLWMTLNSNYYVTPTPPTFPEALTCLIDTMINANVKHTALTNAIIVCKHLAVYGLLAQLDHTMAAYIRPRFPEWVTSIASGALFAMARDRFVHSGSNAIAMVRLLLRYGANPRAFNSDVLYETAACDPQQVRDLDRIIIALEMAGANPDDLTVRLAAETHAETAQRVRDTIARVLHHDVR
jgi:hypothetical protein